jgi:signal transduction histidine kinase
MSLRTRLSLSIAALVLVAVAALGVAVYNLVGSRLDDRTDAELAVQADALAQAIAAAPPASEAKAARSYIAGQALAGSRLLIAQVPGAAGPISNQSSLLLDRSDEAGHHAGDEHGEEEEEHVQLRDLLDSEPGYSTTELAETGELRLLTRRIDTAAGTVTVQAGEPAAATEEAHRQVAKTFLLIGSLTVLAAAGLGLLIATRTARPLERMAGRAAGVDAGRLDLRMDEHTSVSEIAALAESFDRMLDRLEAAFRSQRAFVADASHELRTPLTAILGQAQVLAADPSADPAEVARVTSLIEREVERMGALIDGMLQLERLDAEGAAEPLARFDLAAVAAEVVAALPEEQAERVELDADDAVSVKGRREDTVRIARNLLANALAYGERRVAISVAEAGAEGKLVVDDDGPGIATADRERVFERFARLEESRSRDYGGSGLGLAISRELATAQSARIEVGDSTLGGARMTLCMPRARAGQ